MQGNFTTVFLKKIRFFSKFFSFGQRFSRRRKIPTPLNIITEKIYKCARICCIFFRRTIEMRPFLLYNKYRSTLTKRGGNDAGRVSVICVSSRQKF